MTTNYAINIGRQLGSGGRDVGKLIAERLNIPFYDKELITIASKESGLSSKLFEDADEKTGFFYSGGLIGLRSSFIGDSYIDNYLGNESLFKIQSDVIRELNKSNSAVFVGRCADYILRDNPKAINIFISSPLEERIKRIAERHDFTLKKAKEYIEKTDKRRERYYNY
jgi:cytidylate kinase